MKGRYIFFDTETTGVPKNYRAPITDLENWPRIIQMAIAVFSIGESGEPELEDEKEFLVKPDGWEIPKEKFWIDNGFDQETSLRDGVPLEMVLEYFIGWANTSDYLIAHNMDFDQKILGAEMLRHGVRSGKVLKKMCTMKTTVDFCAIPFPDGRGFKWPKLEELHRKLFECEFDGAHQAGSDVKATAKCFWKLLRLGVIKL